MDFRFKATAGSAREACLVLDAMEQGLRHRGIYTPCDWTLTTTGTPQNKTSYVLLVVENATTNLHVDAATVDGRKDAHLIVALASGAKARVARYHETMDDVAADNVEVTDSRRPYPSSPRILSPGQLRIASHGIGGTDGFHAVSTWMASTAPVAGEWKLIDVMEGRETPYSESFFQPATGRISRDLAIPGGDPRVILQIDVTNPAPAPTVDFVAIYADWHPAAFGLKFAPTK